MQRYLTERQKRNAVKRQFELQLPRFPVLELKKRLTNYRYLFTLHDHVRDVEVIATILLSSFDFYEYRLNLSVKTAEMAADTPKQDVSGARPDASISEAGEKPMASHTKGSPNHANSRPRGIGMIICQKHNSCVPVWCLELDTGIMYQPGALPENSVRPANTRKKRNAEEVRLFVSQLILGKEDAILELTQMKPRTRQHYLTLRKTYLCNRVGRPWAS